MRLNNRYKQKRQKKIKYFISNFGIGILSILIFAFIISGVDRIFFNSDFKTENIDLNTILTKTKYEKATGHKIQVEILNGCGIPKLAKMYTNFLRSKGVDVMDSKNAQNFNHIETKIFHHRGDIERAWEVANIMKIDKQNIIEDKNETLFFDLTIIIGEDYSKLLSYDKALNYQQPY